jgi:hypothetical protein
MGAMFNTTRRTGSGTPNNGPRTPKPARPPSVPKQPKPQRPERPRVHSPHLDRLKERHSSLLGRYS